MIDDFVAAGITDIAFPFSEKTLPEALRDPSVRVQFLAAQCSILTKALDLEKKDGRHRHLASADDTPFEKIAEFGKGAFGYVDKVRSNISYKEYARKLIPRGRTFRKDKAVLREFEREIWTLRKLSHRHVVEIVGSYTDPT
jgi:serine/threonine protein kinase